MKKLSTILAIIFSLALTIGSISYAAEPSLVGKTVQKVVSIVLNGKETSVEGIVINGVTYAPVRNVGEMSGMKVKYEGGKVRLDSGTVSSQAGTSLIRINSLIEGKKRDIEINNRLLATATEALEKYSDHYVTEKVFEETGVKLEDSADYIRVTAEKERSSKEIELLTRDLVELEAIKVELTTE